MKNPDQNLRQTLVKIYNKEDISGGVSGGGTGVFGSSAPQATGGAGLFGGSTTTGGLFGGTPSASSGGIFGGNAQPTPGGGGGLFGSSSGTSGGSAYFDFLSHQIMNSQIEQSDQMYC